MGGAGVLDDSKIDSEVTIDEIREDLLENSFEICGQILNGKYMFLKRGCTGGRQSCTLDRNYPQMWHTHTVNSKFYPSLEDYCKIMRRNINLSQIFTNFGFWNLRHSTVKTECTNGMPFGCDNLNDRVDGRINSKLFMNKIDELNTWLYSKTGSGKNPKDMSIVDKYVRHINREFEKCGVSLIIEWNLYN